MFIRAANFFVYECSDCGLKVLCPEIELLVDFATNHEKLHKIFGADIRNPDIDPLILGSRN